jgi:predicted  nucleic acid-binding Zn-ribbon protein
MLAARLADPPDTDLAMSGRPCPRHRPGQATLELVKASPETQLRLLELADLDAELARIDHRRRGLPEVAEVDRIDARDAELRGAIVAADTSEKDLAREQAKAEADVDQVRTRSVRDRERLDAGQVSSPRDLEALQSEIASLLRRQSELEDVVIDVMERREAAQTSRESLSTERAELAARRQTAAARRDEALGELGEQLDKAADRRASVAAQVPEDLLALYERMRAQHGVGAAALRGGRCEGCHLTLNTVDLNRIRAADDDEVLRCEECRRILVRTPDSGL